MNELQGKKVAVIATDGVEEAEITQPVKALKDAGATVRVFSLADKPIQLFHHHDKTKTHPIDQTIENARPEEYDALLLPGGALNADTLRANGDVQTFIAAMDRAGKPMAVICHAPWELVSAGVARGRTMTSFHTIKDDLENAGVRWEDKEVVVDGNLVTSRKPSDIPAFNREMIKLFSRRTARV